jgi:hypothetical protein
LTDFYEVLERKIENYIEKNEAELAKKGYEVVVGKRLKDFKLVIRHEYDPEMDFTIKTVRLGIFNFRTSQSLLAFSKIGSCFQRFVKIFR